MYLLAVSPVSRSLSVIGPAKSPGRNAINSRTTPRLGSLRRFLAMLFTLQSFVLANPVAVQEQENHVGGM